MSRTLLVATVCALLVVGALSFGTEWQFQEFKAKFQKVYPTKERESAALSAFTSNFARMKLFQKANPLAKFGVTKFSDMTATEFRAFLGRSASRGLLGKEGRLSASRFSAVPPVLNWVTKGAVTPVVDQGQCGSDWAFSAVANIEGVNFVQNNVLTPLSVEELLVCDTLDNGCDGGMMANAYEWLLTKQGGNIMTSMSWPYQSGESNCTYVGKTVGATITSARYINGSETDMTYFTATYGPIAAAVDALSWQFYQTGILTNCSSDQIDHGTVVVGYNDQHSPPYWILKNTWGPTWGMDGYIWIQKNVNACGITSAPITAFAQKYV